MGRTLLVGAQGHSWREWISDNRGDRDLIVLDPANADHTWPVHLLHLHGDKVTDRRFLGALDVSRDPVTWLAEAVRLVQTSSPDAIVQLFKVKRTPVSRQIALTFAALLPWDNILVPAESGLSSDWPVGAEETELPADLPPMALDAQRRARWMEMLEACERHSVHLNDVTVTGVRLGSGTRIDDPAVAYAEVSGGVLHIIDNNEVDELMLSSLMDIAHATRVQVVSPDRYAGLVCSVARQNGDDFGSGMITAFSPLDRTFELLCTAVAPAPVRHLKIGHLRLDPTGREVGVSQPWTV